MLSRTRIGTRLIGAFAVPLLILCLIAGYDIYQKWNTRAEMDRLTQLGDAVKTIAGLSHELQRERGLSATFIASKGAQMRVELAAQVRRTDESRQTAATAWTALKVAASSAELGRSVEDAETAVKALDDKRSQIASLRLAGVDSFAYFTEAIAKTCRSRTKCRS